MERYSITEIAVLIRTLIEAVYFIVVIVSFSFVMGGFRSIIVSNLKNSIGSKAVMIMGAVGSTFHQLMHVFMAVVYAHNIEDVKLIKEPDKNNTLGYVKCFKKNENFYQRLGDFFIGLTPFLFGIIVTFIVMKISIPNVFNDFCVVVSKNANSLTLDFDTLNGIKNADEELLKVFFSVTNAYNIHFFAFLALAAYIVLSMSPDKGDIRGVLRGFCVIFIFIAILNFIDAFNLSNYSFAIDIIRIGILILGFFEISMIILFFIMLFSLILRAIFN
ncbi:hypothetical protein [Clostridium felsineum]|uniref:Uncharacterized protein n=1 Tax=Clostridium felsineum TaxID=36839 RepID=A0A1S8MCH2_9CLOT|nr:hypothetical protein [Clostridium felsineum]MCR3761638.1 hypothetical protein [Clostridium felsineum]URZ00027.1 hypothetical protein CLAUR_000100 [Clostridium felsineum]URZ07328.1 hypothetical protein CLROS_026660 [Clostridium felsineum]URZ12359.1 hypothetical protein CROST_030810 [Clostridium felsineum]